MATARADLLRVADSLAEAAASLADGDTANFKAAAERAAAAKVALEAAALTETVPTDDEGLQATLESTERAYMDLRAGMLRMADRFAGAGTSVATRNAELMRAMVDEADEGLPGRAVAEVPS